jgi:protoporphyrinogen oxidase
MSEVAANPELRWAVVGGGMLGLTLAHRLQQAGQQVTLIEAAPEVGGLAGAWQIGDVTWDRHYHVTLLSDLRLRSLLRELGLEADMKWVETRTGFYTDGKLYSMSNTLEFLRFPPLGLIDKLRLGLTIFTASRRKNWQPLERIHVADWLRRWSGARTFNKIWLPLLKAKLGDCYRDTSASFIWATIARMYAARQSGLKKEMFGYVPGGYATVLRRFA